LATSVQGFVDFNIQFKTQVQVMKNSYKILMIGLSMVLCLGACNKQDDPITQQTVAQQNAPKTEIEAVEIEEGITLFKQDLRLSSADGQSEVVLRLACADKQRLDMDLAMYKYSISTNTAPKTEKSIATSAEDRPGARTTPPAATNTTTQTPVSKIYIEPISVKLASGVQGYSLNVTPRADFAEKAKTARWPVSQWGAYQHDHISPVWTGQVFIETTNPNPSWKIQFGLFMKLNWTSTWTNVWTEVYGPQGIQWADWFETRGIEIMTLNLLHPTKWKHKLTVYFQQPSTMNLPPYTEAQAGYKVDWQ
jgi:hypothetical protein